MSRPPAVIDPATLSQLLAQLLNPNTDAIRQVEATLRTALVQPAFVCDLFEILQHSPAPELRQLAAVLVRRRIGANWTKLDASVRVGLQAVLLNRSPSSRRGAPADDVGRLGGGAARAAEWHVARALRLPLRVHAPSAAEHRELSMLLLASLLESEDVVESLRPHFGMLDDAADAAVDHTVAARGQATLKAVGRGGVLIAEEPSARRSSNGPMLDLCRTAAQSSDEDFCASHSRSSRSSGRAELDADRATPGRSRRPVLAAATEPSMEEETRMAALTLIGRTLENKRKLLVKHKLVPAIVAKLFEACASTEDGDGQLGETSASNDDDNDDDDSVHRRSAQVLHTLGTALPSKHAAPPAEASAQYAQSPRAGHGAAIIALAMTAEGFCEFYSERLPQLSPSSLLARTRLRRWEAACIGLGEFAQHRSPRSSRTPALPHIFMVRLRLRSKGTRNHARRTRARAPGTRRRPRARPGTRRGGRAHAPAPVAEAAPLMRSANTAMTNTNRKSSHPTPQDGGCESFLV